MDEGDGLQSWGTLAAKAGEDQLPRTPVLSTPGGIHMYFRHAPEFDRAQLAVAPGVTLFGEGGSVLSAGTRVQRGASAATTAGGDEAEESVELAYEWEDGFGIDDVEISSVPAWLRTAAGAGAGSDG